MCWLCPWLSFLFCCNNNNHIFLTSTNHMDWHSQPNLKTRYSITIITFTMFRTIECGSPTCENSSKKKQQQKEKHHQKITTQLNQHETKKATSLVLKLNETTNCGFLFVVFCFQFFNFNLNWMNYLLKTPSNKKY